MKGKVYALFIWFMSWQRELQQDIWEYDALTELSKAYYPKPRKLFWIYSKWLTRFEQKRAFLRNQDEFPNEVAEIIAGYIAPEGSIEDYFPRSAWQGRPPRLFDLNSVYD